MKPDKRFLLQPKRFWANVRTLSQAIGYTERGTQRIKVFTPEQIRAALTKLGLNPEPVVDPHDRPSEFGKLLIAYSKYRARVLNTFVEPRLMDVARARTVYEKLVEEHQPSRPPPMNKQKGEKKTPAYFTAIINILIEANSAGQPCDFDPKALTTVTSGGVPIRTLARRIDGAFPAVVNPVAVWEIKEYYYTTTFGSRVADGVYESLLDGMELEELREHEDIDVKHYLMIDDYRTWWQQGRSYLCRIIDMLHMGYIDEALFGYEAVERLPTLTRQWVRLLKARNR